MHFYKKPCIAESLMIHFFTFVPSLAQREEGRLNNEIKRINSEIKDLTEKRNILEVRKYG